MRSPSLAEAPELPLCVLPARAMHSATDAHGAANTAQPLIAKVWECAGRSREGLGEANLHGNQQQPLRRGFLWQRKTVLAEQGPQVRTANEHPAEAQIPVSEEAGSAQSSSYHKARGRLPFPRPLSEQSMTN